MDEEPRRRILVVEDEVAIGRLLTTYLESVGFEAHHETHGEPALRYVTEHRPDLVILDLQLPDIHGYEVCQQLRQLYNSWALPIMMLTGMDAGIDKLRGFACGADAYLTKPFEPPELLPAVTRLLDHTQG